MAGMQTPCFDGSRSQLHLPNSHAGPAGTHSPIGQAEKAAPVGLTMGPRSHSQAAVEPEAVSPGGHRGLLPPPHPSHLREPWPEPQGPSTHPSRFSRGASFLSAAAPPNPNREVAGDTIIFRDTQISSRAVYQCNTSNEHGYLLANAFVSVLGERTPSSPLGQPPWGLPLSWAHLLLQRSKVGPAGWDRRAWDGGSMETEDEFARDDGELQIHGSGRADGRFLARIMSPDEGEGPISPPPCIQASSACILSAPGQEVVLSTGVTPRSGRGQGQPGDVLGCRGAVSVAAV